MSGVKNILEKLWRFRENIKKALKLSGDIKIPDAVQDGRRMLQNIQNIQLLA